MPTIANAGPRQPTKATQGPRQLGRQTKSQHWFTRTNEGPQQPVGIFYGPAQANEGQQRPTHAHNSQHWWTQMMQHIIWAQICFRFLYLLLIYDLDCTFRWSFHLQGRPKVLSCVWWMLKLRNGKSGSVFLNIFRIAQIKPSAVASYVKKLHIDSSRLGLDWVWIHRYG